MCSTAVRPASNVRWPCSRIVVCGPVEHTGTILETGDDRGCKGLFARWTLAPLQGQTPTNHPLHGPAETKLGVDVLASKRYLDNMNDVRRATVYFEPEIHRALKMKAAASDRSVSDMVNEAVRIALAEDAEDLAAFDDRVSEPEITFDSYVKALKQRGKL